MGALGRVVNLKQNLFFLISFGSKFGHISEANKASHSNAVPYVLTARHVIWIASVYEALMADFSELC
eukprot:scaffold605901_cov20-Prasinocladus_malaysianus.AAC.1